MARIDIRDLTDEHIEKLDIQVERLGLKSRSDFIRLIIELDMAKALKAAVKKKIAVRKDNNLYLYLDLLLETYSIEEIKSAIEIKEHCCDAPILDISEFLDLDMNDIILDC